MSIGTLIDAIAPQHGLVLGKTRSGKSSTLRLLVERLLDKKKPVCIIDPKGDWWGLKSDRSGHHGGYPLVIFGGEHADIPLGERAGSIVAELFATGNRSCIVDLGGWMVAERTRFFIDFASTLFRLTTGQRWIVIDEVHNFAPQGKVLNPDAGKMLHWSNRLAAEGAGKGLSLWSASQRPQKVHKDFVTCSETLIAMRVIHPLDRGAIADWIDGCADPTAGKNVLSNIANIKRGQGWVWSPEAQIGPELTTFPLFRTFDSFAAPTSSGKKTGPSGWAHVEVEDICKKMSHIITQHALEDPKALKKRIAELERELKEAQAQKTPKKQEVSREDAATVKHASRIVAQLPKLRDTLISMLSKTATDVQQRFDAITIPETLTLSHVVPAKSYQSTKREPAKTDKTLPTKLLDRAFSTAMDRAGIQQRTEGDESLPKGERMILQACAENSDDGCTREQLTILTGYKRSSRDAYITRLVGKGFLDRELRATESGVSALGCFEPLPRGDALRAHWLHKLPEGERKVLAVCIEHYPDPVDRETISSKVDYKRSSRDAYITRLSARKLVVATRGGVVASATLF